MLNLAPLSIQSSNFLVILTFFSKNSYSFYCSVAWMKIITKNKRAYFDYEFSKYYEAGIVLAWHEVKSIKTNDVNINDAIAKIRENKCEILNMDIRLYTKTSINLVPWYASKWNRTLLLNKKELAKISADLNKPGNVLKPLMIFLNKKWKIKIKLGIGKLKKKVEKKQIIKERDIKKQMDREIKNY